MSQCPVYLAGRLHAGQGAPYPPRLVFDSFGSKERHQGAPTSPSVTIQPPPVTLQPPVAARIWLSARRPSPFLWIRERPGPCLLCSDVCGGRAAVALATAARSSLRPPPCVNGQQPSAICQQQPPTAAALGAGAWGVRRKPHYNRGQSPAHRVCVSLSSVPKARWATYWADVPLASGRETGSQQLSAPRTTRTQ